MLNVVFGGDGVVEIKLFGKNLECSSARGISTIQNHILCHRLRRRKQMIKSADSRLEKWLVSDYFLTDGLDSVATIAAASFLLLSDR